jgi:hypothetical protein
MKKEKYYLNRSTGEISESHATAMSWYRSGSEVEIWVNGKMVLAWVM